MELLPARGGLHIYLAPRRLVAVVRRGGRIVEDGALHIPLVNPGSQWKIPVAALRGLLGQTATPGTVPPRSPSRALATAGGAEGLSPDSRRGAIDRAVAARLPVSISLSGRWCQMVLAPWSDALMAEPAASRFLQMQLSAVYGDAARTWSVSCDDAPYGHPRLACGIDADLLESLQSILAEHRLRCAAIEPLVGTVCRTLDGKPTAFAVAEQGRLSMAVLSRSRVTAFQTQPCGDNWHNELAQAWQRWTLRAPELAAIDDVAVMDLSGVARHAQADRLPAHFRLVEPPFGPAADFSRPNDTANAAAPLHRAPPAAQAEAKAATEVGAEAAAATEAGDSAMVKLGAAA
ncbi:hypothetical protein SAMN05216552_1013110 [Pseudoduganella namucuonensis]|uniref:Uncharacterized protein n=2 Tax=Pseudoduganella namucuonensis TaxID=1035707 RepID=A0A1I7JWJ8_9BURK|nr:hypothetical protein SAMN05216552_1013110 [Pseudoduganella namucuonensis]